LQAQQKGLDIDLSIEREAQCFYNGAPDRIRQILTNIIGNAIKFTEKGTVSIGIRRHGTDLLCFSISDTGIGMTPAQLNTIFDAFAQADESMSRRFGGTGLGTTISKQLVELMGGTISVNSEYGKGSIFEFSIPLKTVESSSELRAKEVHAELPPLNVLIVDDIEQNIDLLSLILKRNNHAVTVTRNGEQALLKMESDPFDIVLMDIQMPVMDGLTAAKKRREFELDHGLPKLPIIALTASVLAQDRKSAEQAGMDGFANKPIDIGQLMGEIARILASGDIEPIETEILNTEQLRIDLSKGLGLWGSKTTLFSEIKRFLVQSENDIASLPSLISSQNWHDLDEVTHKYKGVAGNLALNRLMLMFDELEQAGRKCLEKKCLLCVTNIEDEIRLISEFANNMSIPTNVVDESPSSNTSTDALHATLSQLEAHVRNNEFNEPLLDALHSIKSIHSNEINDIMKACNDFDFELASNRIAALLESLTPNP
jgi:CheY-like chemotaxis protein/HPt (histidine-containing phosphotransfer) domain-containing protein